jgi:hypothetical protein
MSSYTISVKKPLHLGEDFMGAFLPGLFSAKLAKKTLAKFDPTSSTAKYGKVVKAGVIGGLNLIPVVGTAASVAMGSVFMLKSAADAAAKKKKAEAAAVQQNAITNAMSNTPSSMGAGPNAGVGSGTTTETGTTTDAGDKKNSGLIPLLGIGAAAIAALTML